MPSALPATRQSRIDCNMTGSKGKSGYASRIRAMHDGKYDVVPGEAFARFSIVAIEKLQ